MSKVLPAEIHDRPELNLRQGIKSSLNHWRQLIASSYLFYLHLQDGGDKVYSKEIQLGSKVSLEISDAFGSWLANKWNHVANVKALVQQCPLYTSQMEHLQVALQLFLKLAQVKFANPSLADAAERTGGSRFSKSLCFSTNMKILADAISAHADSDKAAFVANWLEGNDDAIIGDKAKEILAAFTEECQFKIRTASGELFFQQDGIYERLRNMQDSVESSDTSEPVGPFRILKSYVKEGMHPYLSESPTGFVVKSSAAAFTSYADMVSTTLSLIPRRTTIYQEGLLMQTSTDSVPQKPITSLVDFVKKLERDVENAGLVYATGLMRRFVCAMLAKPFVVLTGLSGSGKTKLAQAFTDWIAVANTARIVPVGADWTNSEKILGYPNALDPEKYVLPDTGVLKLTLDAAENPSLPFFLVLDEMNLSHVERYFADFLSAMESEGTIKLYDGKERFADDGTPVPPALKWPKNLFVIGTMNVDETTYMFSPKVLDRAHVIEFRVSKSDIENFLDAPKAPDMNALRGKGAAYAAAFLELAKGRKERLPQSAELAVVKSALSGMFEELAKLGSEFAFRSAGEIVNFIALYLDACGYGSLTDETAKKDCLTAAIDAAVVQKLLPKLHGSHARLGPVLKKLKELASEDKTVETEDGGQKKVPVPLCRLTHEKIDRMLVRLKANGFTSFAEA